MDYKVYYCNAKKFDVANRFCNRLPNHSLEHEALTEGKPPPSQL